MQSIGFFLVGLSGLAWTVVYIFLIRAGFKDKTYGMPLFALALNIAWELLYTILGFQHTEISLQTWVNLVWSLFDIAIVFCYFKYGKEEFKKYADAKYFIPWSVLIFLMAGILQYAFLKEFGITNSKNFDLFKTFIEPDLGSWYAAFLQNLMMSVLFIQMLLLRKNDKGQNLTVAIAKWIGTLAPTILFGILLENNLVLILGIFCCVFDMIYIRLLFSFKKKNTNTFIL
jgi:hypothetical protein